METNDAHQNSVVLCGWQYFTHIRTLMFMYSQQETINILSPEGLFLMYPRHFPRIILDPKLFKIFILAGTRGNFHFKNFTFLYFFSVVLFLNRSECPAAVLPWG